MSTKTKVRAANVSRGRRALFVRRGLVALAADVLAGISTKLRERNAGAASSAAGVLARGTDARRAALRAEPATPLGSERLPRQGHPLGTLGQAEYPLAAALARGEQMQRDILATQGELLSADEVAARLQIEPAEVERRGQEGMLLGLALESGETGFPSWQFTDDGLLPGLESVLRRLSVRNSWMRAAFFLSGDLRLDGRTPLEALLHGDIDAVSAAGAAYGEQVAS
ncbi:MAG: hypothetical protein AB7P40_20555 [Chloroflexota bacterium]